LFYFYLFFSSQQKAKTNQQHKMSKILHHLSTANADLEVQYGDKDGLLKEDLAAIRGSNMFHSFFPNTSPNPNRQSN
jgi:hypothetical protein